MRLPGNGPNNIATTLPFNLFDPDWPPARMGGDITKELPEEGRVEVDADFMTLFPSPDGMMHDECMVGIGGTPAYWYPADRDVPADAILHPTVYERLALPSVRNYSSYGKYRPAPLRNHDKANEYFEDELKPKTAP